MGTETILHEENLAFIDDNSLDCRTCDIIECSCREPFGKEIKTVYAFQMDIVRDHPGESRP